VSYGSKNIGAKLAPFISIITRVITNSRTLKRSFDLKFSIKKIKVEKGNGREAPRKSSLA